MIGMYVATARCGFAKTFVSFRVDLNNVTWKIWSPMRSNQRRTFYFTAFEGDSPTSAMSINIHKIGVMLIEDLTNTQIFSKNAILVQCVRFYLNKSIGRHDYHTQLHLHLVWSSPSSFHMDFVSLHNAILDLSNPKFPSFSKKNV